MSKKFFVIGALIIILFVTLSLWQHEQAHIAINKNAGVNSRIEIRGFSLVTIAENAPKTDLSNYKLAHSINEAIGYQLVPLFAGLMLLILLLGVEKWTGHNL